jgi:hypothetical protein
MGPRINPRIIGATENESFRNTKPMNPLMMRTPISKRELLMAYEPMRQKTNTEGMRYFFGKVMSLEKYLAPRSPRMSIKITEMNRLMNIDDTKGICC